MPIPKQTCACCRRQYPGTWNYFLRGASGNIGNICIYCARNGKAANQSRSRPDASSSNSDRKKGVANLSTISVDKLAREVGLTEKGLRQILSSIGIHTRDQGNKVTHTQKKEFLKWWLQQSAIPRTVPPEKPQLLRGPLAHSKLDYDWPRHPELEPFKHQIETTEFLVSHERAFCLNDMGTGKTLSTLWAYDYLRQNGLAKSALVICPLSTIERTWADEIEKNFRGILRFEKLTGDGSQRRKLLSQQAHIYLINPAGVSRVSGIVNALGQRSDIDLIIIDEIAQCARNGGTETFKALMAICNRQGRRRVFGLTGTPMPNSPTDAWAQCRLLVPDSITPYFNRFRGMVLHQINQFKCAPAHGALEIVKSAMQPQIRFERDKCIDLPECVYETREISLDDSQAKLYKEMLLRLHTEFDGKDIDAPNEMVKTMKLMQIACGAPYTVDQDPVFPPMPARLEELADISEQATGKIIVFVPFRGAIEAVSKYLRDKYTESGLPDSVAVIHGGIPLRQRSTIFSDFQKSEYPRILVAQAQAMSHGLTLTAANTIVWFGPTTSADTYGQANARIMRPGQIQKQFVIHIQGCEIERRIFQRLRTKTKLQGVLLDLLAEQYKTRVRPKGSTDVGFDPITDPFTDNSTSSNESLLSPTVSIKNK